MPEISRETIALLTYLMPGFLMAWLFYAFTSHSRPSQFERVVQALIFTVIINALVVVERPLFEFTGTWVILRTWDKDAEVLASVFTALALGFAFVYFSNKDTFHSFLRRRGLSYRSGLPNEWCTVFAPREQFVVVHLKDDRRLYGWPKVWPADPEKGHLFLTLASWVHGETAVELSDAEGILLNVQDVAHVEFLTPPEDRT
jgi:Family of unknown function (DUF6338)